MVFATQVSGQNLDYEVRFRPLAGMMVFATWSKTLSNTAVNAFPSPRGNDGLCNRTFNLSKFPPFASLFYARIANSPPLAPIRSLAEYALRPTAENVCKPPRRAVKNYRL